MTGDPEFRVDTSSAAQVLAHLEACDASFEPRLSSRVELAAYADKLATRAARFEAWSDGVLIGLVAAYVNDPDQLTCFITSVSVVPAAKGKGLAARLLTDCLTRARQLGLREAVLEVGAKNEPALRLYSKLGFVQRGDAHGAMVVLALNLGGK